MKTERLVKLRTEMKKRDINQLLITDYLSVFYLIGKKEDPMERFLGLYIDDCKEPVLFINEIMNWTEDLGIKKVWLSDTDEPADKVSKYIKPGIIGLEKGMKVGHFLPLMKKCKDVVFEDATDIVMACREIKDEEEKELMRRASAMNDAAIGKVICAIKEGITERQLEAEVDKIYAGYGADNEFTIIGFGENAANPHAKPSSRKIKPGDSIVIDIGGLKDNYYCDMTRTVFFREISDEAKEIYETVLEANERAIKAVKPGVKFCDIDAAARNYIAEKGYGDKFTHRTGHGAGISVHEGGDVSSSNEDTLKPGMIFSIEPGIYITGNIGVRIEDLVMVTEDGCEVLNKYTKRLQIIK